MGVVVVVVEEVEAQVRVELVEEHRIARVISEVQVPPCPEAAEVAPTTVEAPTVPQEQARVTTTSMPITAAIITEETLRMSTERSISCLTTKV